MDKSLFQTRLVEAVEVARQFAGRFYLENLPAPIRCRVQLNSSYDGNPLHEDERVYPADSSLEQRLATRLLTPDEATDLLWRDGAVPEWIDVAAVSRTPRFTVVELDCCGRFSRNDKLLYHEREGRQPFHVVGPALPPGYQDGQLFSMHQRASCWTRAEYEALRARRRLAWFVDLGGPDFDDNFLAAIDDFESAHCLELAYSPVRGPGLQGLAKFPRLQYFRLHAMSGGRPDLKYLPNHPLLAELTLTGFDGPPQGLDQLARATPALANLTLNVSAIEQDVVLPPLAGLSDLQIVAEHVSAEVAVIDGASVNSLRLRGPFEDKRIRRMLDRMPAITSLHLDNTRAATSVVEWIRGRANIAYVNLTKTDVPPEELDQLRQDRPQMRVPG
ncbi:MAG: hypothetical protein AB7O68_03655 [Pirellulales bacterium]